ncbi:MAG: TlpA disulfide reductase family protein [Boseongicola sp.]|nr:TlpA disulfide reductase family protein [Boseongicola sp.]MYH57560.1 TlpA family protein disulfide reductase [Boseongicola sp. SB0675_bin_26]
MSRFLAVLYTCLALAANHAIADTGQLADLREGTMRKLVFSEPRAVPGTGFTDPEGGAHQLSDFNGKFVLVNFWATWCAPCRKEMPMLSELQREFGGERFEVVTIATGRNSIQGIRRFFQETGVDNLPLYLDPRQDLARSMAVLGLPATVILDMDGREIARMRGDAEWYGESARAIIRTLTEAREE